MTSVRARSGFTLVELAIVLAIVGFIAGIAAPRYAAAAARYRLKATAHRIAADLTYARTVARGSSTGAGIKFDLSSPTGYDVVGGNGTFASYRVVTERDPYNVKIQGVDFGGGPNVTFDGFGSATEGTVTLVSGRLQATVTYHNASGTADVTILTK